MTLATIKQDILKQYRRILSNKYTTAFNFLLSPCCTLSGTGVAQCLVQTNVFVLNITLDGPLPSFPGTTTITVNTPGVSQVAATYTAPLALQATLIFTAGGIIDTTQDVLVTIFYPTSVDGSVGVYHSFTIADVIFDGNPCD